MDQNLKRSIIMDNYQHPFNYKEEKDYQKLRANNPSCIDDISLFIDIENNVIKDLSFTGEACAISTSATSIMIKNLIGKTVDDALVLIDNFINMVLEKEYDEELLNELIVYDTISKQANRISCALLPFKTIKKYLEEEYGNKRT